VRCRVTAGLTPRVRGGRALFAKLPTGTSEEEKEARDRLFQQFDPNGNGFLSLAEIDRGIRDVLGLEVGGARGSLGTSVTRAADWVWPGPGPVSLQASHHESLPGGQGRVQGTESRGSALCTSIAWRRQDRPGMRRGRVAQGGRSAHHDDFVSRSEFRLLLVSAWQRRPPESSRLGWPDDSTIAVCGKVSMV